MKPAALPTLGEVSVAVLAGGLGTRLRPAVPDWPKTLAAVAGRPFILHLLDWLAGAGCRTAVLCTGHLGETVRARLGDRHGALRLAYSQEPTPLGTAGALRRALPLLASDPVLVLNGDSYCEADLAGLLAWHLIQGASATLLLAGVPDTGRYGRVTVDEEGAVTGFEEKHAGGGRGWISAGVSLLGRPVLEAIRCSRGASLEREIYPAWVGRGLHGYRHAGRFLDIGTPEDYALAQGFFAPAPAAAGGRR